MSAVACKLVIQCLPVLLQGLYHDAIEDYTCAVCINPAHVKAHYNRAIAFERLQQYDAALSDYAKVTQLDSSNSAAHLNAGLILFRLGRYVCGI